MNKDDIVFEMGDKKATIRNGNKKPITVAMDIGDTVTIPHRRLSKENEQEILDYNPIDFDMQKDISELKNEINELKNIKKDIAEFIFQFIAVTLGIIGIIIAILSTDKKYLEFLNNQLGLVFWGILIVLTLWFLCWLVPKILTWKKRRKIEIEREKHKINYEKILQNIVKKELNKKIK